MAQQIADIDRAREAIRREAWPEAYQTLRALDPSGLSAEDLEALADAAWWVSDIRGSLAARQRAYSAWARAGEEDRAAFAAWRLAEEHFLKGDGAVATGWRRTAQRHVVGRPETVVQGYLALAEAEVAHVDGNPSEAIARVERAADISERFDDRDLLALAIQTRGRVLIAQGRLAEGAALFDEAMASVVAGELSPFVTGWIYCQVIYACLELADIRRASEWNEAAMTWCLSIPAGSLANAMCRLNQAEVVSLRGELARAEAEARRAAEEFTRMDEQVMAAEAFYATGEYRRRMGDLSGAGEAFGRAHELGKEPQPGLALVRLAQGNVDAASSALRLALDAEPRNALRRSRLLAAQVEVALAAGDREQALAASRELDRIAGEFESPALVATAAMARGALRLAEDDAAGALPDLRQAWAIWQELKVPYEAACARVLVGRARRGAGDEEGARRDLEAARAMFERLDADGDARRTAKLVRREGGLPGGLTQRECEVLRLVAAGRSNRQVAEDLFISEHTVARHLQNIFAKLGVSSRAAATAFAVEHGLA